MDRDEMDDPPEGAGRGFDLHPTDVWERVIEDMEVTAEEYEEDGWSTLQLHPGDVTIAPTAEPPGIDIVLPNSEFEALDTLYHEGVRFSEYDVFRAESDELEVALLVAKDEEQKEAVLVPIYYDVAELASLVERVDRQALMLHLHQLDEEPILLQITQPELLVATEE